MEMEKAKNMSASQGRRSSKRQYSASYKQESPRKSQGSYGGGFSSGILKSGRKKSRPRTADRVGGGYNPSRGVATYDAGGGSPIRANNMGVSYSPYQVPNAARIPGPNRQMQNQKGRGVSFERGQGSAAGPGRFGQSAELPDGRTSGMGYLHEQIGRREMEGSPLRNASPRRMQEMRAKAAGGTMEGTQSYNMLPGNTSPLRSRSPGRDSPTAHFKAGPP